MAMWEELGIVPTADLKAIRRAYAGRLRGIDPDQDPAAFQRLRKAFEAALSQAEQPARASTQTTREPRHASPAREADAEPTPPPRVVVPSPLSTGERTVSPPLDDDHTRFVVDDAQWRALFQACRSALAAGDVEAAFDRLMEGWGQGLVPIAAEDDIVAEVMAAAVDDCTLPGERFQFMARQLDWDRPITVRTDTNVTLRERVLLRLEAEAWYATLLDNATKKDRWPTFVDQQERLLASVLLDMAPWRRLALVHSAVIRWQLERYDAFEQWLQGRIDQQRITQLKETLNSGKRDSRASLYWLWHLIVSVSAIFGLMFVTRFGRSSNSAIREENPASLAWWRRVRQQASLGGIPLGRMTLEPMSAAAALATRIVFIFVSAILFVLVLVVAIAWVGAAILFPPLGVVTIIVFVIRRARKKRKSANTVPGD